MGNQNIHFIILNITSWGGHPEYGGKFYGKMILCSNPEVTFQNLRDFNVNELGEHFDLVRELSFQEAKSLDGKNWLMHYQVAWRNGDRETLRFSTVKQITEAGMKKYKEMNIDVPFISLYNGLKFRGTVTLNETEKYFRPMVYFDVKTFWMQELDPESPMFYPVYHETLVKEHGSIENYFQSEAMLKSIEGAKETPYPETDEFPCIILPKK